MAIKTKATCDECGKEIYPPKATTVVIMAAQGICDKHPYSFTKSEMDYITHRYQQFYWAHLCPECAGGMSHCWGDGSFFGLRDQGKSILRRFLNSLYRKLKQQAEVTQ